MAGPYILGLTGNIACGKTTVGKMLLELGAQSVIDADTLAHVVIRRGRPAWQQVVDRFGPEVLDATGEIDRTALGQIVFGNREQLRQLESIIHPAVGAEILDRIRLADPQSVLVLDAVKLVETGLNNLCDASWMITCTPETQFWRLTRLRGHTPEDSRARLASQESMEPRLPLCSAVIDTSGTMDDTRTQVQNEFRTFLAQVKRPNHRSKMAGG